MSQNSTPVATGARGIKQLSLRHASTSSGLASSSNPSHRGGGGGGGGGSGPGSSAASSVASFGAFKRGQNIDEQADAFVSDFTYLSVSAQTDSLTQETKLVYEPAASDVALMFVDMSGYSALAEKLADQGAHALATVVNAYFAKILDVVHECEGDVLKFAGDAIMVVWVAMNSEQSQRTRQRGPQSGAVLPGGVCLRAASAAEVRDLPPRRPEAEATHRNQCGCPGR
jgi:hypothetical protein